MITGNQVPDHATIARFIVRHQQSLAELFTSVLRLCAKAGLVKSGVVAVDGTKLTASANSDSNVDYDRIAREIIAEAIATDEAEDEQHGEARGDELPPELSDRGRLDASGLSASSRASRPTAMLTVAAGQSRVRRRWTSLMPELIASARRADGAGCANRTASSSSSGGRPARPIPRSRVGPAAALVLGSWRTNLAAECRGNKAYEDFARASAAARQAAARRAAEAACAAGDPAG